MRKVLLLFMMLFCLCLITGCGRTDADDPNILRGIYSPVFANLGTEETRNAAGIVTWEDGYAVLLHEDNYRTRKGDEPYREGLQILHLDKNGAVTETIPVELERYGIHYSTGERGVYTCILGEDGYELLQIGWDGSVLHRVNMAEFKPGSASSLTPEAATIQSELPIRETEDGLAIVWGKRCVLLDESLTLTGEVELPGKGDTVFAEGEVLWLSYEEKGIRMLGKAEDGIITESWPMPECFCGVNVMYWSKLIGCTDGWLYGWGSTGLQRWQFGAEEETVETVLHFVHSGIPGQKVSRVTMLPDGRFTIHTTTDNGYNITVNLYEKAPDKDLSEMTVLTLACIGSNDVMEQAVLRFNAAHDDAYIRIVTYEQYNTADEPIKGYNLLRTDLTTGLLQADILCGETYMPMDLYPLMTGTVQTEDIAPCVRNAYETDGKLYQLGAGFILDTIAGRRDALDGMTGWDLETFLDFADRLGEGEYLMEEICQRDAMGMLVRGNAYAPFLKDGTASFEDPLFTRYLQFLSSLPIEGQKYMDHGTNNTAQLLAGEITMDQLQVESAGENLYWNGKIKLIQGYNIHSIDSIIDLCRTFNTTDISFIGYPAESGSGVNLVMQYPYSIPVTCRDPALAWEFVESVLLDGAVFPETDTPDNDTLRWNSFSTLWEPYFAHLESLLGLRIFTGHNYGLWIGWDLETDEYGCYNGQPGILQEIDEEMIGLVRHLYETAGWVSDADWELNYIVMEEESRYLAGAISAEECADIVQSRVSIYLAENS